jgi:hypothetical protein
VSTLVGVDSDLDVCYAVVTPIGGSMTSRVRVALGATINIGNFENLRIDYELTTDVLDGEDYVTAFNRVTEIVEDRLIARINEEKEAP